MTTTLHIGAKPKPFVARATHLDGVSATPWEVELRIDEARGALIGPGIDWPLDQIRELPDQASGDLMVLRLKGDPVQRLLLTERDLQYRLPNRTRRAPVTQRGRLVAWACAAICSVALILLVLVPLMADQLAGFIPPEGERALGDVTLTQIREALDDRDMGGVAFCDDPTGREVLDQVVTRLTRAQDLPVSLRVHVLDHDMVNAFALPGGHIVLFDGLIKTAERPEELAAVIAHEIGHVISRDPTRHALRSAGSIGVLGLIFGDFAGGAAMLLLAERLIEAQYSQTAEIQADAFATQAMIAADLPPDALADMFEQFQAQGGDSHGFVAHFHSHPQLTDRIAAARSTTRPGLRSTPLLSNDSWRALQEICARP